tara:strand:- start:1355 stop:2314 length:960 start_codon:yes stop_codon:yes gene_type:complete
MKTLIIFIGLAASLVTIQGQDKLTAARHYLESHQHELGDSISPGKFRERRSQIAALRDPETKFGPYVFALSNGKANVLTQEQLKETNGLIAARQATPINWHDTRNTIRMQCLLTLWAYATEWDRKEAAKLEGEWEAWTDLRLAFMFEEFIARERFQRGFWNVLSAEQQRALGSGDYDTHIKKNTGHAQAFSANKQVIKALGKPIDPVEFDEVSARWEEKWKEVSAVNKTTAKFSRQRELAMELCDESFAIAAWEQDEAAFRGFVTAERDAIRELVQSGYEDNADLRKKAAAYRNRLRAQMIEKYGVHAEELLRQLGEIK